MGFKDLIKNAAGAAFPAFGDLNQYIPYHSIGIVEYSPSAADLQIEDGGNDYMVYAIRSNYDRKYIDNESIMPIDQKVFVKGKDLEFTPKINDTLEMDDVIWQVISVRVDSADAVWELQVRPTDEGTIDVI